MRISTHRLIQLSELQYILDIKRVSWRICAGKLARIGNNLGAIEYTSKAQRAERILYAVKNRIENGE